MRVEVNSDSQIVTSQIIETNQARDSLLQKYLERVKKLSKGFEEVETPRLRQGHKGSKKGSGKVRDRTRPAVQAMSESTSADMPWSIDLPGHFPVGPRQVKYLIVDIDYYTKGVETKPLASISSANYRKFLWRQVLTRFGIPEVVISDNGTQFADKKFGEFLSGLGVKQKFSSVEYLQTNYQVKAANKVILQGFKKQLDQKKGAWADELTSVLWSHKTTPQSSTGEMPFRLTYGVDTVIFVEVGESSPRLLRGGAEEAVEKDLIDETRELAHLSETALKQRIALRYKSKVLKRSFEPGDLVLRRNDVGLLTPGEGKLTIN
ncbi:uncharacterized protein [Arachis hypogaea]|uniref:uncharacterized protein n=1 Tax=Arachis hypogaea TaxID=3818 RepID=UPI003B21FDC7